MLFVYADALPRLSVERLASAFALSDDHWFAAILPIMLPEAVGPRSGGMLDWPQTVSIPTL